MTPANPHAVTSAAPASTAPTPAALDPALPFFTNKDCPYFPCHPVENPALFNCLFCFCPLYTLGPACPGNFAYTESGIKDCSGCALPHEGNTGNKLVNEKFTALASRAAH